MEKTYFQQDSQPSSAQRAPSSLPAENTPTRVGHRGLPGKPIQADVSSRKERPGPEKQALSLHSWAVASWWPGPKASPLQSSIPDFLLLPLAEELDVLHQ